jgi:hypothetical protein
MLARRLTSILPAMTLAEANETMRIHRVAGLTGDRTALVTTFPCPAPHHTISDVGLIGGGHVPMPGDVSLAHNGVRFLDELPECRRHLLEVLHQPREDGITSRQSPIRPRSGRTCGPGRARDLVSIGIELDEHGWRPSQRRAAVGAGHPARMEYHRTHVQRPSRARPAVHGSWRGSVGMMRSPRLDSRLGSPDRYSRDDLGPLSSA